MKRILIYGVVALSLGSATLVRVAAVQKPRTPLLLNFDQRQAGRPPVLPIGADRAAAVGHLRQVVPGAKIEVDRVLGTPCFVTHPHGFLSGPAGVGRGISTQTAQTIPAHDPYRITKAFLEEHRGLFGYGPEVLASARIRREFVTAHNGLKTVVWEQELDGIPVFESILMSHVTRHGELVNVFSRCVPDLVRAANAGVGNRFAAQAAPPVSAAQAVVRASSSLGEALVANQVAPTAAPLGPEKRQSFNAPPVLNEAVVHLVWLPLDHATLRLCWSVCLTSHASGEMFQVVVDAETGDVIIRRCLTEYITNATYRVYTSDSPTPFSPGHPVPNPAQPALVNRMTIVTNACDTNASPLGWINDPDNETMGNNVDAHTDWDANDQPDLPRPLGNPFREFVFPIDYAMEPTNSAAGAVVNLFFWCNWYHDKLWQLGFTEEAGNFQNDNFGRGGLGNDAVQADAQDGSGLNNAFFSTPPDGSPGRATMFLWDGPNPDRDGSLDQEGILHELTHGTSTRLVGGGIGIFELQTRGLGEGWSDFYSLAMLSEPADALDGNYAWWAFASFLVEPNFRDNYYFGIRRYPYSTDLTRNPLTFKDIDPTQIDAHAAVPRSSLSFLQPGASTADEVHKQGEVWCVTLWEVRANLITKYGYATGNQLVLQLVTDGMKLCPVNPNFLQARDAILQADLLNNGSANFDEIWQAFAKRGLGGSAASPPSSSTVGVQEAFDLPGVAFKSATTSDAAAGNGNGAVDVNECTELTVVLINNGRTSSTGVRAVLSSSTPGVTISQADSSYLDILPASMAANLVPFKFYTTPAFGCGTPIKFVLLVQTDQDTRQIAFSVDTGLIAAPVRFNQATALPIPDRSFLGVDSSLNVSGFSGLLAKATVSLHIRHPQPYQLEIRLIAPNSNSVTLSQYPFGGFGRADYGTGCSPDDVRTMFDDKATTTIAASLPPYVGTFKPQQPLAKLTGLTGSDVNGVWRLHITDPFFLGAGSLECWSLQLAPFVCSDGGGDCSTDIAVSGSVAPPVLVVSSNVTYTLRVDNQGLNTARNVVLTDALPLSTTYLSAQSSVGACNHAGGVVTCTLGTIPSGASVTIDITARANAMGRLTNTAMVATTVPDTMPGNNSVTLLSTVLPPTPVIVGAKATLIAESLSPPSGGLDAEEMVTIDFALQNVGSRATTNLIATLLNSNGVSGASSAQIYGALLPGGPPVAKRFIFTANDVSGGVVTARLRLVDGVDVLPEVAFSFGLGSTFVVTNQSRITLPEQGPATNLYPSTIFLSDIAGTIKKIALTLRGVEHTFPDDLDVLLVGPRGEAVMLMSDAGGGASVSGLTLAFEDGGGIIPDAGPLPNGTYRPIDYDAGDSLPPGAPSAPYAGALGIFNGSNPNGIWSLYVADDMPGDSGRIANGWSLHLTTVDPVNATADLRIGGVVAPSPVRLGSNVTYTLNITNLGPDVATAVYVTNSLPANVTFVSASASPSALSQSGNILTWSVGTLTNLGRASLSIVATATRTGTATNVAVITGDVDDPNSANSRVNIATSVTPEADLAVLIATAPNPVAIGSPFTATITVTNAGPDIAVGVSLTNRLPAGLTNVSVTTTLGTCSTNAGQVVCNFTRITNGRSAVVTITGSSSRLGEATNVSTITTGTPVDRVGSNNIASAITLVTDPFVILAPDGAVLLSENYIPLNGGLDVGEYVALSFRVRNVGVSNTVALQATLRASGGVTVPSGARDYGVVEAGGASVGRSFAFTAFGTNGGSVVATLDLSDGGKDLGSVSYTMPLSGNVMGNNSGTIPIPDNSRAQPYPAGITLANVAGVVEKVTVTLSNLAHAYPDDVDVLLVGPRGQSVLLMSDAGGSHGVQGVTLRFDDTAPSLLPDSSPLTSGVWQPSDYAPAEEFPTPAPTQPYGTNLAVFHHTDPNGVWSLFIQDEAFGDLGSLNQGWSLELTTVGYLNDVTTGVPANLGQPTYSGGTVRFNVVGSDGATYLIEASDDFQNWTPLDTVTLLGASAPFEDTGAGSHIQRFYRARNLP